MRTCAGDALDGQRNRQACAGSGHGVIWRGEGELAPPARFVGGVLVITAPHRVVQVQAVVRPVQQSRGGGAHTKRQTPKQSVGMVAHVVAQSPRRAKTKK